MISVTFSAFVVWSNLFRAYAVAEGANVRCEELDVRFKTLLQRGTKNQTESWIKFNLFTEFCVKYYPDNLMCAGRTLNDGWDWDLETNLWTQQVSTLESVVRFANLSNEPLRLYFLFHAGHSNQSVFFEAKQELFTVSENGSLGYCLGPPNEDVERRLRECRECPQFFAKRINATEVSQKWIGLCRANGDEAEPADPPANLGFVCRPRPVTTTTITPTTTTTTTTEVVTTTTAATGTIATETSETAGGSTSVEEVTEGDAKRAASAASSAVVPVAVLAFLAAVAFALFVWRARLVEAWKRFRGASAVY